MLTVIDFLTSGMDVRAKQALVHKRGHTVECLRRRGGWRGAPSNWGMEGPAYLSLCLKLGDQQVALVPKVERQHQQPNRSQ